MRIRFLKLQLGLWLGVLAGGLGAWVGAGWDALEFGLLAGAAWGTATTVRRDAPYPSLRRWAIGLALLLGGLPGCLLESPVAAVLGGLALLHLAALSGDVEASVGVAYLIALPATAAVGALTILCTRLDLTGEALAMGLALAAAHRGVLGRGGVWMVTAYCALMLGLRLFSMFLPFHPWGLHGNLG